MLINLAQDGIFPITHDEKGDTIKSLPASGFSFPGTIQGEGKLNGIPSLFIRLAGCNLHCSWITDNGITCECDTAYAAFRIKHSFQIDSTQIVQLIQQNQDHISHLVITGGEPFLQAPAVEELCFLLKKIYPFHITIETNATIYNESTASMIDFFSLSPKLASSIPRDAHATHHADTRINSSTIQSFITHARKNQKDFQLKFVYASEQDIKEIKDLLSQLQGWKNEDILLMPMGINQQELQHTIPRTLEHCIRNGWRFCNRLHISLFGNKQGV